MYFWYFYASVGVIIYFSILHYDIRLNAIRQKQKTALEITLTALGNGVLWGLIVITYAYAYLTIFVKALITNR